MKWLVLTMARILQAFPIITTTRSFFKSASISPRPSCEWAVTLDPQQHAAWVFWQLTVPNVHQLIPTDSRPNFPDFPTGSHDWITKPGLAGWLFHMDGITQLCLKIGFPVDQTIPSYWPKSWLSLRPHIRYTWILQDGISKRYRTWHVALLQCCLSKPGERNKAQVRLGWNSTAALGDDQNWGIKKKNILHTKLVSFWTVWSCSILFLVVFMWVSSDLADDMMICSNFKCQTVQVGASTILSQSLLWPNPQAGLMMFSTCHRSV